MFDLQELKSIPLNEICSLYGIDLKKQGKCLKGKIRPEKTPSFSINIEKNMWKDFGINLGGDTIALISYLENVDRTQAMFILADKFNISKTSNNHEGFPTPHQFKEINIISNRVMSNFIIDLSTQSIDKISKWELKYDSMSIYELAKKNLKLYHKILYSRSYPLIYSERKHFKYLLEKFLKSEGVEKDLFKEKLKDLENDINKKIDIYNLARKDNKKISYLKVNLERELK